MPGQVPFYATEYADIMFAFSQRLSSLPPVAAAFILEVFEAIRPIPADPRILVGRLLWQLTFREAGRSPWPSL